MNEKMTVVYLSPVERLRSQDKIVGNITNAVIRKSDSSVAAIMNELAPTDVETMTLTDYDSLCLRQQKSEPASSVLPWSNHHIENFYALETLNKIHGEISPKVIPSVLVFGNPNIPGGDRAGLGQEEGILAGTNLAYGMRPAYPENSIWHGLGGIYAVLCMTQQKRSFWAIVMAAPNLGSAFSFDADNDKRIETASDAQLFNLNQKSLSPEYMRHILGEVLMQFYMVKCLRSPIFMTGLFGCGRFNNDPEYYAAAVKYVSELATFRNIKVCYALGKNNKSLYSDRETNKIFTNPNPQLERMCGELFDKYFKELVLEDNTISLIKISVAVKKFYSHELMLAMPFPVPKDGPSFWNEKRPLLDTAGGSARQDDASCEPCCGCLIS